MARNEDENDLGELLDERVIDESNNETIADVLFDISLGQRTPVDAMRFMLNMRDVKGKERRRLKAIVNKEDCRKCIADHDGKCVGGHNEAWIKKILA